MTFGALIFGESTFAGTLLGTLAPSAPAGGGGGETPPVTIAPFTVEIAGVQLRALNNSLHIDIELGRQGTASFEFVNMTAIPNVGAPVRILFYSEVLFVGALDRINVRSDLSHSVSIVSCECTDNSYLLFRRMVKRSFANSTISQIANALIADELINDGITLGTVDVLSVIPIAEGDRVSAFDLLNDVAVSVGALFYIDNDRKLNFITRTTSPAPYTIDEDITEECKLTFDRETFRNKQTVIVTGTPVSESDTALEITYTAQNGNQIPQQAIIEGTSGVYNDIEAITHPTSNFTQDLLKLGLAYAKILLGVRGAIRETMQVRTRQYGFRVGQLAAVDIPHLGRAGNWIIQKLSLEDEEGMKLITNMDISPSSLRRRAQELWIDVVRKGKVLTMPPTAITTNISTYSSVGTFTFTVPAGATLMQVTLYGGGGGGGGGAIHNYLLHPVRFAAGGAGGRGGLSIIVLDVTEGDEYTIIVPGGGLGGTSTSLSNVATTAVGTNGANGGIARLQKGVTILAEAYGGQGGFGAQANALTGLAASYAKSPDGNGLGDVVTAGGGGYNGGPGNGSPFTNAQAGGAGSVVVEW